MSHDHQYFKEKILETFRFGEEEEGPRLFGALLEIDLILVEFQLELGDVAQKNENNYMRNKVLSAAVQADMVFMRYCDDIFSES